MKDVKESEILKRVLTIVSDKAGCPATEHSKLERDLSFDSLDAIETVMAIEDAFVKEIPGFEISEVEAEKFKNGTPYEIAQAVGIRLQSVGYVVELDIKPKPVIVEDAKEAPNASYVGWDNYIEYAYSIGLSNPVIETCDYGHKFWKEERKESRCPHCLALGLERARTELVSLQSGIQAVLDQHPIIEKKP